MKKIIATAAAVLSAAAFAELAADFSSDIGPVRPEIHSSGFGPTICSQTAQDLESGSYHTTPGYCSCSTADSSG